MSSATSELVVRGLHALRRSALGWGVSIVALVVVTAAFWPGLEHSDALANLGDMESLLAAFGAQNIATPAGYLDGQLYALMLPLLLSGMAIAGLSALTSGDEDAGRLELLHALPVSRSAVWTARWAAAVLVLVAVTAVTAVAMLVLRPAFSLDEVTASRIVFATLGSAILAIFHATVAFAAGGFGASRGTAVAIAVAVLVGGYVLAFLVPLADSLEGARSWSPWYWALSDQPVSNGVDPGWQLLLVALTAALAMAGVFGVNRRDIRSA